MSLPFVLPEPGPVVTTGAGAVRGVWREAHGHRSAAFLAVPYAAPPVGALRLAAPAPPTAWDGIRDASQYGPTPQRRPLSDVTFIPEPSIPGDDVLTLNVFTPSLEGRAPVLVWIHGGGYVGGSPASPWYDGRSFARDGVVVVTIAYRLGIEGYGVLDGAPSNRGVLDQVAALEWVRDEIAAFGGDPGRVTIAGQSAGGGAVTTLLVTPAAHGLFHGAIAQSGAFGPGSEQLARRAAARVARRLGIAPTAEDFAALLDTDPLRVEDALRELEPSDPLTAARRVVAGAPGLDVSPVVDGSLVPLPLAEAHDAGLASEVPLLLGATAHEFTGQGPEAHAAFDAMTPAEALALVGAEGELAERVLAEEGLTPAERIGQSVTEAVFREPVRELVRLRDQRPTWVYDVRRRAARSGLAEHCSELPFVWDLLDAEGVEGSWGPNPPAALADSMHSAWVRFVRAGDPGWAPGTTRVFE